MSSVDIEVSTLQFWWRNNPPLAVGDNSIVYLLPNQYIEHVKATVSKTDVMTSQILGEIIEMEFKQFIQDNIEQLEIPFQPSEKKRYPPNVWRDLHKSLLVTNLQHYRRAETVKSFMNTVLGGDDLGGLTLDNVIDMWLDNLMTTIYHIIGSANANPKIKKLYDNLCEEREIECNDPHNEVEDDLVHKGVEIPTHTHTVKSIEVTDENREQFDEYVTLVLQNFDSNTYGELPEEYSKAGQRDIKAMVEELKEVLGDETDVARLLGSLKSEDDSFDSANFV